MTIGTPAVDIPKKVIRHDRNNVDFGADAFPGPRAFARHMLREGLFLRPLYDQIMAFRGTVLETILYRSGPWQIELVAGMPNVKIERHRHLRCSSAELLLNGSVWGTVSDREYGSPRGQLTSQLRSIDRGEWHGGGAGPDGLVYLSFQHWTHEPTFISQDWEPWTETQES